jgi:DNA polymerase (family 10)
MSSNEQVAAKLEGIAQMMELLGEDGFRVNAHNRAARAVSGLAEDVATLAKDRDALIALDGVGPKTADKIIECVKTGTIAEYEELMAKVPQGLRDILQLPGLGPKTVRAMWQTLGVDTMEKLKAAIADGSLKTLPRMGDKAVAKISEAIAMAAETAQRHRIGPAWEVAQRIVSQLRTHKSVAKIEPAGSLRRGRETVGDLDVVVALKAGHEGDAQALIDLACSLPGVTQVISAGITRASLRVLMDGGGTRWGGDDDAKPDAAAPKEERKGPTIQTDIRVVPLRSYGAALQYFTGGKDHNVRLRGIAQDKGLTLNEWGLFDDATWKKHHPKGKVEDGTSLPDAVAGEDEASIYAALGVSFPQPEQREDRGEFDVKTPAELVELVDIRAELHAHTTASDGAMTIEQLTRMAHARGFHTLAVTDHSQSSTIAGGLKPDRLRRHIDDVHAVHEKLHKELGITVLAGSEVDILADGSLDYKDELLAQLDVVVASPHAALTQDPATATARLLKAIAHPLVHILGHPTGRLVARRAGLSPDMAELIAAAKQHNVALEVNAHWMRLDLRDTHVRQAVNAGCLVAIDCDVHAPSDYDNLRFGVMTARRGWLTKDQCVNTWTAKKLHAWLKSKR